MYILLLLDFTGEWYTVVVHQDSGLNVTVDKPNCVAVEPHENSHKVIEKIICTNGCKNFVALTTNNSMNKFKMHSWYDAFIL